jgi:acetyl-CoA carboxylase biotin carboxyl carrier protein
VVTINLSNIEPPGGGSGRAANATDSTSFPRTGATSEREVGAGSATFAAPMAKTIKAHITGTVWKIEVKVGDSIDEGTTVVILESMKMEMPVESEDQGVVDQIHVTEAQPVTEGQILVTLR